MKTNKLINLFKILYRIPPYKWSFGKGKFVRHIDSIDLWIKKYSSNKGVFVSNRNRVEYPEVTGYLLETLIKWGYSDKARDWFDWLISIQNSEGGWSDKTLRGNSVFFDSAQIIRGIKYYSDLNKIDANETIEKYLTYFSKNKESNLVPKSTTIKDMNWHLINLQSAWIVNKNWPEFIPLDWLVTKLKKYFSAWEVGNQISHFDIYILEAMYELGIFPEKLKTYISYFDEKVERFGFATCDKKNNSPCFTGSAQLGVLYYKVGRKKDGDRLLFNMLKQLNTKRGNWTGSSTDGNYAPMEEVSWTLKYFLDLLYYHYMSSFDLEKGKDWDSIESKFHGKILQKVKKFAKNKSKVLDMGCGLGRYMLKLKDKFDIYGIDISKNNVNHCKDKGLRVIPSSLTNIILPKSFPKKFDLIFAIESFEHAAFPSNALLQLKNILEDKGRIVIIDKDLYRFLHFRLCPFERYYSKKDFQNLASANGLFIKSFSRVENFIVCEMVEE